MFENTKIKLRYYPKEIKQLLKREKDKYVEPITLVNKGGTKLIAHRGLSGIYRENTVLAFTKAGELSYFGIETDVHITADGKYVIIHDDTTNRLSDDKYVVEESTLATLQKVKIRPKNNHNEEDGTTIPQLFQYIKTCKDFDKTAVLELKNHFKEEHIGEIISIIKEIGYLEKTIFISFDWQNCVAVKKLNESSLVQFLCCNYIEGMAEALAEYGLGIDIYYRVLNEKLVAKLHSFGVEINCWTVDNKKDAEKLIAWGVDYITTNILL